MDNITKVAGIVGKVVAKMLGPLTQRVKALEKVVPVKGDQGLKGDPGKDGVDGKSVDVAEVRSLLAQLVAALPAAKDGQDGKDGVDGKSADMAEVRSVLAQLVAALPPPKDGKNGVDGKSADMEELRADLAKLVAALPAPKDGKDGKDGSDGSDGKSVDGDALRADLASHCAELVAQLPKANDGADGKDGVDGKSIDLKDALAAIAELVAQLPKAKDGVDGKDGKDAAPVDITAIKAQLFEYSAGLADDHKSFVLGEFAKFVGSVPLPKDGKDGKDGVDGKDAPAVDVAGIEARLEASMKAALAEAVAALPKPKDGRDGVDAAEVNVDAVVEAVAEKCAPGLADSQRNNFTVLAAQLDARVDESVPKAVAALPIPKDGLDGKSVDPVEVGAQLQQLFLEWAPVVTNEMKAHAAQLLDALPKAKDGVDGKDGTSVRLGDVQAMLHGWLDGFSTKWELASERRLYDWFEKAIAKMPVARDGKDGIGLQSFKREGRVLKFLRSDGEVVEDVLPIPIHWGVWDEKRVEGYQKDDWVTFGGSVFMATRDTKAKPETDDSWKLVIKRGRDGRNGGRAA